MSRVLLEICVGEAESLAAALDGGADRIELCSALELGGLTPTPGLIAAARMAPVPVYAMIRPRGGDFVFSAREAETMRAEIAAMRAAGLAGVVLGASRPDGRLDTALLERLARGAEGMHRTLHRAFDLVPDLDEALETAIALGFERILTSGRARTALEGATTLARLVERAAGRITILAASGIRAETAPPLLAQVALAEVHASCAVARPQQRDAVRLGFSAPTRQVTTTEAVRALRRALDAGLDTHI